MAGESVVGKLVVGESVMGAFVVGKSVVGAFGSASPWLEY